MGIFDGCLLASDVDGTLIASGFLPPKNVEAIKYFINEGGKFSISTGRSAGAVNQIFRIFDKSLTSYSIVLNGGMIFDFNGEKSVYDMTVSSKVKEFTKYISETDKSVGIEIHSGGEVYVMNRNSETDLHEEYEELNPYFVSFDDVKDYPWNKVLMAGFNDAEREKRAQKAKNFGLMDNEILNTCAAILGEDRLYLELLPVGASKGEALKKLKEIYSIKNGGLFAIGDYYNDLSMLTAADISSATGDAPDELKEKVNYVSKPCRDGAVADFIEYLKNNFGGKN